MKNELGLPDWLVEVVEQTRNQYDPGEKTDYSATSLLVPPMIYTLQKEHQPEEDVSNALPAFFGTCVHNQIEYFLKDNPRYIVEERLYHTFYIPDAPGDKKEYVVSAQIDLFDKENKELSDHKLSKMYSFQKEKFEYEAQLNLQQYLLRKKYGEVVESIKINGFAKDWSAAGRGRDYPPSAYIPVDFPVWADEDVEAWVAHCVVEKEQALNGQIRLCDSRERWQTPSKIALMKKGRKSAVKLYDSMEEAERALAEKDEKHYIEDRPGIDIRCTNEVFCPVREHCSYYQERYNNG